MSYIFIRLTVGHVSPLVMVESRMFIGAIFVGLFACCIKSWRENLIPYKKDLSKILAIALFNSILPFAFFAYSMQHLNAGLGGILNSVSPVWTAIIGAIWLKDRLSSSRILGMLIAVSGIVFLMWGKAHFSDGGLGIAVLGSVGLTFCYGMASNMIKVFGKDINTICLTFNSLAFGALLLFFPVAFQLPSHVIPLSAWIGILGLGIGSTAIGYILFFRLIDQTSPSVAISVTFIVPVFSILWGELFLQEQFTYRMLFGGVIIIIGTALAVGVVRLPAWQKATN